ncbi:SidA/IucD/PvdA family monooxygenase [Pseudomonas asplenii]|uniref:Predicted flavoprotein CzcO associated with the cation diffusion facilitator CzcD n=1 Tax=Pseudomonas asplenii TaxID=53407 RepID=A0A1H6NUZ0_9PSED|nr:NAD(P)/FAD-dependent oxidoreductase [Pseudomonas fuscovaginae]SEI20453.1 Predicted flavoprotein CzcO associated with the cation diffusion facilitator CzcD [Pseudomonas fuscovaginae]
MSDTTPANGLATLEARLRQDLDWLDLPAKPWVKPRLHAGEAVLDVAIIGGGMAGLALAAELRHLGVTAVIFDQAPAGFEGPWATTARMETLRSPKQLTGPALGLPALTFRAWFEAQFGLPAWEQLDKIPRLQWADYLRWYRKALALEVRNEHRVSRVTPRADGLVELTVQVGAQTQSLYARHVVLATGRDGLGGPWVPDLARALPHELWAHSADGLQNEWFEGKRVAVIGGGASAMDSAATALEAGATKVDLLIRRAELPRINKGKGAGNPGMTHGYWRLPAAWKWRLRNYLNTQQVPPPRGSTLRVSQSGRARFLLDSPLVAVQENPAGGAWLDTPTARIEADFVVFATGFRTDFRLRPEFSPFSSQVRTWRDRFEAPADEKDAELAELPDLGSNFEFQERSPGTCPGLNHIHCFSYPAALSFGAVSGDIPAISEGARRLAQALIGELFNADIEQHYAAMRDYAEPELLGDEWVASQPDAHELRP